MISLPDIKTLRVRCQKQAALDLILSPEVSTRRYFFDATWNQGAQVGCMNNGSGNEWFCLFDQAGWGAIKGLNHESQAWSQAGELLSHMLKKEIPVTLGQFSSESSFRWDETSFAFYKLDDSSPCWTRVADKIGSIGLLDGGENILEPLLYSPAEYAEYASEYFERTINHELISEIFSSKPITEKLVYGLNPDVRLSEIENELFGKIGYQPER